MTYELCVAVAHDEVDVIRARAGQSTALTEAGPRSFRFRDPFGFQWSVQPAGTAFRSSGEIAGRWIG